MRYIKHYKEKDIAMLSIKPLQNALEILGRNIYQHITQFKKSSQYFTKACGVALVVLYSGHSLADAPPPSKPKVVKKKIVKKAKKIKKAVIKTEKLSSIDLRPQVSSTPIVDEAPSFNPEFFKQLRTEFKLIDATTQGKIQLPRIIGGDEGKRIFAKNEHIYVQKVASLPATQYKNWDLIKVEAPIYAQTQSAQQKLMNKPAILAYRATYRGDAIFVDQPKSDLDRFWISNSPKESDIGDYLIPSFDLTNIRLMPYPNELNARILNLETIDNMANQGTVALINKGLKNGLSIGHQLEVYSAPQLVDPLIPELENKVTKVETPENQPAQKIRLPQIKKSDAVVFDATQHFSYVYIPYSERAVNKDDVITNIKP